MQSETDSNLHNVLFVIREPGAPLETNDDGFVCFCCFWLTNNPLIRKIREFDERKFTNTNQDVLSTQYETDFERIGHFNVWLL